MSYPGQYLMIYAKEDTRENKMYAEVSSSLTTS